MTNNINNVATFQKGPTEFLSKFKYIFFSAS